MTVPKHASEDGGKTEPSIGELVKDATTQLSTVIHGEIELAKLELKSSLRFGGGGVALFGVAIVVLVFGLTFAFFGLAELLARYLVPRWAAFEIVCGFLVVLAGIAALLGYRMVKRVRAPERTIKTTKDTVTALRHAGPGS